MSKLYLTLVLFFIWGVLSAGPLWMRYPSISPDGKQIVFSYKGDIYKVSADGGRAEQLTTNPGYETYPIWSPYGKYIAFASDRYGNLDIFIMLAEGGTPKRLTTYSGINTFGNSRPLALCKVISST